MTIMSEDDYRDACTVLTWYEHIPAKWKEPAVCRDSKVFTRLREACLDYERQALDGHPARLPAVHGRRAEFV